MNDRREPLSRLALATLITALVSTITLPLAGELANRLFHVQATGIAIDLLYVGWMLFAFAMTVLFLLLHLRKVQGRAEREYRRGIKKGQSMREKKWTGVWVSVLDEEFNLTPEKQTHTQRVHVSYDKEIEVVLEADKEIILCVLDSERDLDNLLACRDFGRIAGGLMSSRVLWRTTGLSVLGDDYILHLGLHDVGEAPVRCSLKFRKKVLRRID